MNEGQICFNDISLVYGNFTPIRKSICLFLTAYLCYEKIFTTHQMDFNLGEITVLKLKLDKSEPMKTIS